MTLPRGRIYTGDELTSDQRIECDVCVIGSGSGGAWVAHELMNAGLSVVMLEEGGYHTRAEFDMTEPRAYANLYQELANRTTDDLSISLLQGRSVGGGTTVNWSSSFRTPERIFNHWRQMYGVETLSTEVLTPHWEAIEKRLHIAEWPIQRINENNRVLWDGLGLLGYHRASIRRNVNNCINLGACGLGCPVDAKQSMSVTIIADAVEKGLTLIANASARQLSWSDRKVNQVIAEVLNPKSDRPTGVQLTVTSKVVVASGGSINTPGLLLRSRLDAEGRVGRRTWLHPVVVMVGQYDREINGFSGAPQSVYSEQFAERGAGKMGFVLEVPPVYPMLAGLSVQGDRSQIESQLARVDRMSATIAVVCDGLLPQEVGATVRLRDDSYGRYSLNYKFLPEHTEAFQFACTEMAKIHFAAGARRVISLHHSPVTIDRLGDLPRLWAAPYKPLSMKILSAHQMGGCAIGKNPRTSVVDPHLRFHTLDNLFIVDGSVFPTSVGVNPQQSIFGIARWAATHIAASVPS